MKKINILLCDTFPGLLPEYIPSYTSMFTKLFSSVSEDIVFEEFRVLEGHFPEVLHTDELYLITGCNQSAYAPIDWIEQLHEWIRQAVATQTKLVGICFGHQVICRALGGKVERFPGGWGMGIRESEIYDEQMKSFFPNGTMSLLYNHHDQVMCIPEGAVCLAASEFCRYDAVRIHNHILTFQGHPEYVPEYEQHLLIHHSEGEDQGVIEAALRSIEEKRHMGKEVAQFIWHFFSSAS